MPHPFGIRSRDEVRAMAQQCVAQLSALVAQSKTSPAPRIAEGERITAERSPRLEIADDLDAVQRLFRERGWSDGLPVIPPTPARVDRMLAAHAPEAIVAVVAPAFGVATVEAIAINAVAAGCEPAYLPVLIAAVKAVAEPQFNLQAIQATTNSVAVWALVNGPIARTLEINAGMNCLGQGTWANATIGRALRLLIVNVLGGIPGQLDRSTLGHPGKFTLCLAEDEEGSPWLSLATERGVPAGASAVTVMAVESPHQIMNEWTHDPKELAETYAAAIRANMLTYSIWAGNYAIVVPGQHRQIFAEAGWSKRDLRECVHERARVSRREWRAVGKGAVAPRKDEDAVYTALRSPDDLLVVAAGGPAGGFGAILPPWYGQKSLAVTKGIE